ncbi:hypothetical protein P7K49_013130 [Saguinus oedipus]|uniref:Uncharacterized protein n=1 Tax=Saguinus oedipus TaxID=9490 RepID=A0ABQ9VFL3_SAGOE|nr:hypothetical protein P7K49_013130 [Saguinus oedipus]
MPRTPAPRPHAQPRAPSPATPAPPRPAPMLPAPAARTWRCWGAQSRPAALAGPRSEGYVDPTEAAGQTRVRGVPHLGLLRLAGPGTAQEHPWLSESVRLAGNARKRSASSTSSPGGGSSGPASSSQRSSFPAAAPSTPASVASWS